MEIKAALKAKGDEKSEEILKEQGFKKAEKEQKKKLIRVEWRLIHMLPEKLE